MLKAGYVAIVGRPNAGKSTLLNQILGTEVSIVTPKAQTTRDRIAGILTEPEGQMIFLDTPGIHRAKEGGLNQYMVQEAKTALESPNLIWYLVDPNSTLKHEEPVLELLKGTSIPVFVLMNKVDLLKKGSHKISATKLEGFENDLKTALTQSGATIVFDRPLRISGLEKSGVKELLKKSWELLPEGEAFYPDAEQVSDRPTRFFVGEKIREKLFLALGEEVPYSCAVEILNFDETSKPVRIEACIYVERESQKGIVIGQGGKKIKEVGEAARKDIENFLGEKKIFLGLKVKLLKDWSRNGEGLRRLGYTLPTKGRNSV